MFLSFICYSLAIFMIYLSFTATNFFAFLVAVSIGIGIAWARFDAVNAARERAYLHELSKQKNKSRQKVFTRTKSAGYLIIDEKNKLFRLKNQPEIYEFKELINYKVYIDEVSVESAKSNDSINLGFGISAGRIGESVTKQQIEKIDFVLITNGKNGGRKTYRIISDLNNS